MYKYVHMIYDSTYVRMYTMIICNLLCTCVRVIIASFSYNFVSSLLNSTLLSREVDTNSNPHLDKG